MANPIARLTANVADRGRVGIIPTYPFQYRSDYAVFRNVNDIQNKDEGIILYALTLATKNIADDNFPLPDGEQAAPRCSMVAAPGAAVGAPVDYWDGVAPVVPVRALAHNVEVDEFIKAKNAIAASYGWLLDLVSAEQNRTLTQKNIQGYFMAVRRMKITAILLPRLIGFCSGVIPDLMVSQAVRDRLINNKWISYHTSYASTPGIIQEALDAIPALSEIFFPTGSRVSVAGAIAEPWSMQRNSAIPVGAIVVAAAYVKASSKEVGDWYQGKAAVASSNRALYTKALAFYKRAFQILVDQNALDGSNDMAALVTLAQTTVGPANPNY
jgi:hypothetical protein